MNPLSDGFLKASFWSKSLSEERASRRSKGVTHGRYPEK
jgi:hypothetical protein